MVSHFPEHRATQKWSLSGPSYVSRFQMFVFGEVQDPTTETVNLVEDIIRGQIIELVRTLLCSPDHTPFSNPISRHHFAQHFTDRSSA